MGFLLFCLLVGAIILYPKLILKGIWAMIVGGAVIFGLIIVLAIMLGSTQWGLELRTVMSVMTQSRCCTGVDTMIWRIGSFYVESVSRTLNRDLRNPTDTAALGRVRRGNLCVFKGWKLSWPVVCVNHLVSQGHAIKRQTFVSLFFFLKPKITHQNSLIDNLHAEVWPDWWILSVQQRFFC